ncbi:MAG: hypothetical protein LBL07_12060 [Tannerella sp.]|jgi:uncharacterized repeat protein (TIGR02543 family)|nr:hypothetical protein [Tannerella sp.]
MPVIADVDGDGQAELIVNGYTQKGNVEGGYLRVFKAPAGGRWAPARKVWNQYSYTSLNVHDDLTVTQYPSSPALRLPGKNKLLGDGDDVFPFNNIFEQQTMLDEYGNELWLTPDAPHKANDVFTGWTGANGDEPEAEVTIPHGSTGERDYYANYLYSGREAVEAPTSASEDKIWSFEDGLYVRTMKAGSTVRVYSPDGILYRLQTVVAAGEMQIKLPQGIYIVTINNGASQKVMIE